MSLWDVVGTRGHLDERLRRALRGPHNASAVAPSTVTWEAFLTGWSLVLCDGAMASREVERLTLSAATRAVLPRYDAALTERAETVDGFAHTLDLLRRHEVTPAVLEQARAFTEDPDEGTRTRLRALAEVMADQDERLAAAGLHPGATRCTLLARAVDRAREEGRSPASLGLPEVVRWWHVLEVDPARVGLAVALARWLGAHGGGFELQVICEPRRMQMPPPLDRALRTLEGEERGLELRYGLRDPGADTPDEPLRRWLAALTDPSAAVDRSPVGGAVTLAEAQGPDDEARWVVSRVARWIDEGVGAHEVAVVFAGDDPETRRCVGQALDEARIPWSASRAEGLLSSPVARALLALPRMVARGAEREEVLRALAVLQGNAPRAGEPAPWRVSQALRVLGVESLFDTELGARFKHGRRHHPAVVTGAVVASIDALSRDLWALAQDGTVAEQAERLGRWIDRAGGDGRLVEESRAVMATADIDPGAQAILRALARDEAGVAGAAALLAELPSIARAAGRDGAMSAGEFGEMLLDLARARTLPTAAPGAGGGVQLLEARDAVGRSFAAVALPGLHEGAAAARGDAPLWGESERRAVNKAKKLPLARGGGREESSRVLLAALATATRAVAASAARHDSGGRARATAAFFGDLQRASGAVVERIGADPLARSRRVPARGAERVLRSLATQREAGDAALGAGLAAALRSVGERSAVEWRREAFFAKVDAPGDPYNGRVDHDAALRKHLELERWADARDPLDTTTLERAARCGYKAFALKVLRIDERPEVRETLDEKERGHLLHALLEAGQDALKEADPADPAGRWAMVQEALDEAGARFSLEAGQVDASLLEADLRAIRRQVELWLARRLSAPEGWTMLASEVGFGPKHPWPAVEIAMAEGPPVAIRGRIDGVERMGGVLRAVEFKSGRGDGYRRRLQQGALETQFQLVVYAAALERARAAGLVGDANTASVDGTYVGFRDLSEHGLRDALAKPRRATDAPWDIDALITDGAAGDGRLGDAVRAVVAPLRAGRFEPRPRDCQFCQYRSLCRVEAPDEPPDDEGPTGTSGGG